MWSCSLLCSSVWSKFFQGYSMFSSPRGGVTREKWFLSLSERDSWGFWLVKGLGTCHSSLWTLGFSPMRWGNKYLLLPDFLLCLSPPSFPGAIERNYPWEAFEGGWSKMVFQFKTLLYPKTRLFPPRRGGVYFSSLPVFWCIERWAERMDKTVSWTSPLLITLSKLNFEALSEVLFFQQRVLSGYRK